MAGHSCHGVRQRSVVLHGIERLALFYIKSRIDVVVDSTVDQLHMRIVGAHNIRCNA